MALATPLFIFEDLYITTFLGKIRCKATFVDEPLFCRNDMHEATSLTNLTQCMLVHYVSIEEQTSLYQVFHHSE